MDRISAEIMTIGDEILIGQILDTNTQWISQQLDDIGIKTVRKTSVGDDEKQIIEALKEAEHHARVIIITGGLGPTKDDITKRTLADYFDDTLVLNQEVENHVRSFFESRGLPFSEVNKMQAYLPSKATCLFNDLGTAPGMMFEKDSRIIISLPGVPYEMKNLIKEKVIPTLISKLNIKEKYFHKTIRTVGIGESFLSEKLENWENSLPKNIKLAYLPSFGQVRLRLSASGTDEERLKKEVDIEIEKLKPLIGQYVFSYNNEELEEAIGRQLNENNLTVATAESCTGGYVGHLITSVPGSSAYYFGGIIAYSNSIKESFLDVNTETLENYGAVSEETVKEMADNVRIKFGTDFGLATSGIAGPSGGTPQKPVGTVCIAVSTKESTTTKILHFTKKRDLNIKYTSTAVLNLLRITINEYVGN